MKFLPAGSRGVARFLPSMRTLRRETPPPPPEGKEPPPPSLHEVSWRPPSEIDELRGGLLLSVGLLSVG